MDRAESGTPAGRAAACARPQAHLDSCRSCCTRSAAAAGSPPADTTGQPPGQRHRPGHGRRSRHPRDGDPRSGPGPPTSWTPPGCPAASRACSSPPAQQRAAACAAASGPAGHPSSAASRSSRCSATRARRRPQLLPEVSDHRLQRGDLPGLRRDQLRLLPDQRITRIRGRLPGRRIGHSPQSSRKPRSPTTATPRPTLERNPRLLAATPGPGTSGLAKLSAATICPICARPRGRAARIVAARNRRSGLSRDAGR